MFLCKPNNILPKSFWEQLSVSIGLEQLPGGSLVTVRCAKCTSRDVSYGDALLCSFKNSEVGSQKTFLKRKKPKIVTATDRSEIQLLVTLEHPKLH